MNAPDHASDVVRIAPTKRSAFIAGPAYDGFFFLGAPLLALVAAALLARVTGTGTPLDTFGGTTAEALALRAVIHAHLVIVFARSHGNRDVFRRHPTRFIVVPVILFAAMVLSPALLALCMGVVVVWDLYHSSMQTFGLGRIYDARAGGDVRRGRLADVGLNHAIYIGPFLCGPMFLVVAGFVIAPLVEHFAFVAPIAGGVERAAPFIQRAALVACGAAIVFYAATTWRRHRRGEPVSLQKHALYAITAVVSVAAWGFNSFGYALLIVNVFHALQYFGIVAFSERENLAERLGFKGRAWRFALVFVVLVLAGAIYGFWFGAAWQRWVPGGAAQSVALALINLVALLHFWYDGFIWSVRRGDV